MRSGTTMGRGLVLLTGKYTKALDDGVAASTAKIYNKPRVLGMLRKNVFSGKCSFALE
jgi:hypothetical protein